MIKRQADLPPSNRTRLLNPREQGDLHEALDESDLPHRVDLIDAQSADLRFVELIRPELRDLN